MMVSLFFCRTLKSSAFTLRNSLSSILSMSLSSLLAVRCPVAKMEHSTSDTQTIITAQNMAMDHVFPLRLGMTTRASWASLVRPNFFKIRSWLSSQSDW